MYWPGPYGGFGLGRTVEPVVGCAHLQDRHVPPQDSLPRLVRPDEHLALGRRVHRQGCPAAEWGEKVIIHEKVLVGPDGERAVAGRGVRRGGHLRHQLQHGRP